MRGFMIGYNGKELKFVLYERFYGKYSLTVIVFLMWKVKKNTWNATVKKTRKKRASMHERTFSQI